MTKIYLHGELAHIFGNFFKLKINNALSALKGIDANKKGFLQKISSLSKNGIYYSIIVDNEEMQNQNQLIEKRSIESIHIIPIIYGSGELVAAGIGLVAAGSLTVAGQIVAGLVNMAISLGVSFLMNSINKQATPPQQSISVGGATSIIEAKGRSYIFSNNVNAAEQGSAIPVGYGRMKVSSQILSASVKSYPTNINVNNEFKILENSSAFLDFLTD